MGEVTIKFNTDGNLVFELHSKEDIKTVNDALWVNDGKYEWESPEIVDWAANQIQFALQLEGNTKKIIGPQLKGVNPKKGIIITEAGEPHNSPPTNKVCPCKILPNDPCSPG